MYIPALQNRTEIDKEKNIHSVFLFNTLSNCFIEMIHAELFSTIRNAQIPKNTLE